MTKFIPKYRFQRGKMGDEMRKECRKCLFYTFDLGLKGKMGLERSVTR